MKKLAIGLLTLMTAVMLSVGAASCGLVSGLLGGGGSSNREDYIGSFSMQSVTYQGTTYESGDTYDGSTVKFTLEIMNTVVDGYDGGFKLTDSASLTSNYYYLGGWTLTGSTITLQANSALSITTQSTSSVKIVFKGTLKDGTLTLTSSASNFPSKLVLTKN